MFDSKEKTIDGTQFRVTLFPAVEALRLQAVLLMKIAPALARGIGALGGGIPTSAQGLLGMAINGQELEAAIQALFTNLPEDEYLSLIKRLFKGLACFAEIEGQQVWVTFEDPKTCDTYLDLVFSGRTLLVFSVLLFILETNFPDLFLKLAPLPATGGQRKTVMSKPGSKSSKRSSSASGPLET